MYRPDVPFTRVFMRERYRDVCQPFETSVLYSSWACWLCASEQVRRRTESAGSFLAATNYRRSRLVLPCEVDLVKGRRGLTYLFGTTYFYKNAVLVCRARFCDAKEPPPSLRRLEVRLAKGWPSQSNKYSPRTLQHVQMCNMQRILMLNIECWRVVKKSTSPEMVGQSPPLTAEGDAKKEDVV